MADRGTSHRLHPSWIVLRAIHSLRAFAIPIVVLLVSRGQNGDRGFLAVGGGLALLGVASRTVEWWRFRYELSGGELRVYSGLLARQERFVPVERIQAVDVTESPLQRLFRVVGVRIETAAGGSAANVVLGAVTRTEAESLRHRLGSGRPLTAGDSPDAVRPGTVASTGDGVGRLIRRLSLRDLLIAGATSGRVGPALAVVSFGFQLFNDIVPDSWWQRFAMHTPAWSVRGALSLLVVVAVGAWLLAMGSTILTYGGFELRRDGDRLLIRYGLLDRRRSSIPLTRIQAVTMTEGLLRQPFRLAAVRVESAGYGKGAAESGILFPLIPRSAVPALLAEACPDYAVPVDQLALHQPPSRARQRYIFGGVWRWLGLAAGATAIAALLPSVEWRWGLVALAAVPFAALHGWLRFHDSGWVIDAADRLVVRGRQMARETTIASRQRLQLRAVEDNPFQRRARLATFRAATASRGASGQVELLHLDQAVALDLLDHLGPRRRPNENVMTGDSPGVPSDRARRSG